jgi:hypothetical protein
MCFLCCKPYIYNINLVGAFSVKDLKEFAAILLGCGIVTLGIVAILSLLSTFMEYFIL